MVLGLGPEIAGARRLILIALADNMNDDGWAYPGRKTIADKAGIKRLETVTEHLGWLESEGWLERHVNAWAGVMGGIPANKRPNVYRFTPKLVQYVRPPRPEPEPMRGTRNPGSAQEGSGYTESGERAGLRGTRNPGSRIIIPPEPSENTTSPTPPEEGEQPGVAAPQLSNEPVAAAQLFEPADAGASARTERTRNPTAKAAEAMFEPWWSDYPAGVHRGPRASALRAFKGALAGGASVRELELQLGNFNDARRAYRAVWQVDPPLMLGSTFLNSKRELWANRWEQDDLTYWLAPVGQEWGRPRVLKRDEALRLATEAWEAEQAEAERVR
jgi:hypothetical protein